MKKRVYLRNHLFRDRLEAGLDEAGRGCLAGPVFAAAVILPPNYRHGLLNDSKKIDQAKRNILRSDIEEKALAWAVGRAEVEEISRLNILQASMLAMHRAVEALSIQPQHLLVDGNYFNTYPNIPHTCQVRGDARFKAIAAASILAKTHRDEYMLNLALQHPEYAWETNCGYGTKTHREAILEHGLCPHHRVEFCEGILSSDV